MKQSIKISKDEKDSMNGVLMNNTHHFNPVLSSSGFWCISITSRDMITNPDFLYLKSREPDNYESIIEATSLSDVFNSDNLTNNDVDNILTTLKEINSLSRKDIRFRGVKPSESSKEDRSSLMSNGVLIIQSKSL